MIGLALDLSFWELTGLAGAAIYALSYLSAAYDRIPSQCIHFYTLRLCAACLVMVGLWEAFNLAAAVIQVFFIVVSLIGVMRHLGKGRASRARHPPTASPAFTSRQASTAERN